MNDVDSDIPKRRRYYFYKKERFTCEKCNWNGMGAELKPGELSDTFFEVECPKCLEVLGMVMLPLTEEVLVHGSEDDKAMVRAQMDWRQRFEASRLKDIGQLPDLSDDDMEFVLHEVNAPKSPHGKTSEGYIVITYKGEVIWREMRIFEYLDRFFELANLLKRKYGSRMIDLIPDGGMSVDLGGDCLSAFDQIKQCRKALCENRPRLEGL